MGERFRAANLTVDPGAGVVLKGGAEVRLQPLSWKLLLVLLRHPGQLLVREELHQALWPGVFVGEDALPQAVRRLRRALGDDVVATVPRRGYRFEHEVVVGAARGEGRGRGGAGGGNAGGCGSGGLGFGGRGSERVGSAVPAAAIRVPLDRLLGRSDELAASTRSAPRGERLVALHGPVGVESRGSPSPQRPSTPRPTGCGGWI